MNILTPIQTEATAKHSFNDLLAKQQAAKHNSDLANLVSAYETVRAAKAELERIEKNIETMAKAIEDGHVFPVEDIRKVYQQAMSAGKCL